MIDADGDVVHEVIVSLPAEEVFEFFTDAAWGCTDPEWRLPPGSSLVSVEFEPVADGTRVRLTHSRLPGDLRAIHDEGWTRFLVRLLAVTAGVKPPPYPEGDAP